MPFRFVQSLLQFHNRENDAADLGLPPLGMIQGVHHCFRASSSGQEWTRVGITGLGLDGQGQCLERTEHGFQGGPLNQDPTAALIDSDLHIYWTGRREHGMSGS